MTDPNRQIESESALQDQGKDDDPSTYVVPNEFVHLAASGISSAGSYDRRIVKGSLAGTQVEEVEFDEALFASADLSKTKWRQLQFRKVRLQKCDLANACWTELNVDASILLKCRCTGLQWLDASCCDSQLIDCNCSLGAFHGSKFRNCYWENCDLREADFEGAELTNVVFRKCDLRGARFPGCRLKEVDFRGSSLNGMQIEPSALRGACVDPSQLLDLASVFGIVVESLDDPSKNESTTAQPAAPTSKSVQFSLRTLFIVITVLTVVIALVANHPMIVIGLGAVAVWILEVFVWFGPAFMDLRGPKTTEQVRRERSRLGLDN